MRFDESQFARRQFGLDRNGLVLGPGIRTLHMGLELGKIQMQSFGDGREDDPCSDFRARAPRGRRAVIDDHAAVAVENFAARSRQRNGPDAVALRQLTVDFMVPDLQHPEAADQEQEYAHRDVLKDGDASEGETGFVAKQPAGRFRSAYVVRDRTGDTSFTPVDLQFIQDPVQRYARPPRSARPAPVVCGRSNSTDPLTTRSSAPIKELMKEKKEKRQHQPHHGFSTSNRWLTDAAKYPTSVFTMPNMPKGEGMRQRILSQADARAEEHAGYRRPPHQREIYRDQKRQLQVRKIGDEARHVTWNRIAARGMPTIDIQLNLEMRVLARDRENRPAYRLMDSEEEPQPAGAGRGQRRCSRARDDYDRRNGISGPVCSRCVTRSHPSVGPAGAAAPLEPRPGHWMPSVVFPRGGHSRCTGWSGNGASGIGFPARRRSRSALPPLRSEFRWEPDKSPCASPFPHHGGLADVHTARKYESSPEVKNSSPGSTFSSFWTYST